MIAIVAVLALSPIPDLPARPAVRTFVSSDGLPQSTAEALAVDGSGRLWVGTQDGLAVFDGRGWQSVTLAEESASSFVTALAPARDGGLWVGTMAGVRRRTADGRWSPAVPGVPVARRVHRILEDAGGALWVGTERGLIPSRSKPGETERPPPGGGGVRAILERGDGLVVGGEGGLAVWSAGRWTSLEAPGPAVNDVLDGADGLWAATDGGVFRKRDHGWEATPGLPDPQAYALERAADGSLWAGTRRGLAAWNGATWVPVRAPAPLTAPVWSLQASAVRGRVALWVGTRDWGVSRVLLDGAESFDPVRSGAPEALVYAMAESGPAASPAYWFGTDGRGLHRWRAGAWTRFSTQTGSLPDDSVNVLLSAKGDGLWVGTDGGLVQLDSAGRPREWALRGENVYALARSGPAVLAGTNRGVATRGPHGWSWLATSELPDPHVRSLLSFRDALYVGTREGGLAIRRGERWTVHAAGRSLLPDNWVNCIRLDAATDTVWVGTDRGLVGIDGRDPDRPWSVIVPPILPNRVVYDVIPDRRGGLLAITNRGTVHLTGPRDSLRAVRTWTSSDGLPADEGWTGLVDRQGRVWITTVAGVARIPPRPLVSSPIPRLLLAGPLIAGHPAPLIREGGGALDFTYVLPDVVAGERIRYRTQLEGLEAHPGPWTADGATSVPYLPGGRYSLRVWARGEDGAELGTAATAFEVRAVWWRTGAGRAAFVGGGMLLALVFLRARLRAAQLRAEDMEARVVARTAELALSERQSRERAAALADAVARVERARDEAESAGKARTAFLAAVSHELRTPLTSVRAELGLLRSGVLGDLPAEVRESVEAAERNSRRLARLIEDLLDFQRAEVGRLFLDVGEVDAARLVHEALEAVAGMTSTVSIDVLAVSGRVRADHARLEQVLVNLLGNAVKFSPPGSVVTVAAAPVDGMVEFQVADEGRGVPAAMEQAVFEPFQQVETSDARLQGGAGLGLAIARAIVAKHGGEIGVRPRPQGGSVFWFRIPSAGATPADRTAGDPARLRSEAVPAPGSTPPEAD